MDYYKIKEISDLVKRQKEIENCSDGSMAERSRILKLDVDKKLQLDVTVTDSYLAQIMLSSQFGGVVGILGMKLTNIRFGDLERKDVLIKWMGERIKELEQ